MARSRKKISKSSKKYSPEQLRHAVKAVKDGCSQFAAAKKYAIPRSTLFNKISGKSAIGKKPGPATVLSTEEEEIIEKWILNLAVRGFPVKKHQLLRSVQMYLNTIKRTTPFVDNFPGRKWYASFLGRHPIIAERMSQNLTPSRAAITKDQIKRWHDEVYKYCEDNNLLDTLNDSTRVFNMDEKGFVLTPKNEMVLARRGDKAVYNRSKNDEKECVTALLGGNAAGKQTPPMIVLPYKRMPSNVLLHMPANWSVGISDSGWQTQVTFYDYMSNVFHKWLLEENIKLPVILFIDGHKSHISLTLSEFCATNQIELVALFPNSTHVTQPMDVTVFKPLNASWTNEVNVWKLKHEYAKIENKDIAPILNKAINNTDYATHLEKGFRKCGLFPFKFNNIDLSRVLPAAAASETSQEQLWNTTESVGSNTIQVSPGNKKRDESFALSHLQQFESLIDGSILNLFRISKDDENWSGSAEYAAVFVMWKKMNARLTFVPDDSSSVILDVETLDNQMETTNDNSEGSSVILAVGGLDPQVPIELTNNEIGQSSILCGDDASIWTLTEDGQLLYSEHADSMVVDHEETNCTTVELDDAAKTSCSAGISDLITESNDSGTIVTFDAPEELIYDESPLDLSMPKKNRQTLLSTSPSTLKTFDSEAFKESFFWTTISKPKKTKERLPEEKRSTVITNPNWIRDERKKLDDQLREEKEKFERKIAREKKKEEAAKMAAGKKMEREKKLLEKNAQKIEAAIKAAERKNLKKGVQKGVKSNATIVH